MVYTPLITAADFVGPRADVLTTTMGVISILITIAVVGMIIRVLTR